VAAARVAPQRPGQASQGARADALSAEQRADLVDDAGRAYGPYEPEAWKVRERIKELDRTEAGPEPVEGQDHSADRW
jgi:hypothetical protein